MVRLRRRARVDRTTYRVVTWRDVVFAFVGTLIGAASAFGAVRLRSASSDAATTRAAPSAAAGSGDDRAPGVQDATDDPALVANANLVASLHACWQRLESLSGEESRLEAEREAEADASESARARRRARREPSQDDWKQLASVGTIRYLLPCASFTPSPEVLNRLGLAPRDVPAVQSAFSDARGAAWGQIRPLCATAAGSTTTADRLGLESCPQVILDAERGSDPAAADAAMRAVGAVKAGLTDPSTISASDAVATTFLVLTGIAKDAESRLGSVLGAEDAHAVVYGNNGCGRATEFTSPASAPATQAN